MKMLIDKVCFLTFHHCPSLLHYHPSTFHHRPFAPSIHTSHEHHHQYACPHSEVLYNVVTSLHVTTSLIMSLITSFTVLFPCCIIITTTDNSIGINSMSNNRGRIGGKGGGITSQQHNLNQKKNNTMENSRNNSIDNVKENGRSKRNVGLSHQHNTN